MNKEKPTITLYSPTDEGRNAINSIVGSYGQEVLKVLYNKLANYLAGAQINYAPDTTDKLCTEVKRFIGSLSRSVKRTLVAQMKAGLAEVLGNGRNIRELASAFRPELLPIFDGLVENLFIDGVDVKKILADKDPYLEGYFILGRENYRRVLQPVEPLLLCAKIDSDSKPHSWYYSPHSALEAIENVNLVATAVIVDMDASPRSAVADATPGESATIYSIGDAAFSVFNDLLTLSATADIGKPGAKVSQKTVRTVMKYINIPRLPLKAVMAIEPNWDIRLRVAQLLLWRFFNSKSKATDDNLQLFNAFARWTIDRHAGASYAACYLLLAFFLRYAVMADLHERAFINLAECVASLLRNESDNERWIAVDTIVESIKRRVIHDVNQYLPVNYSHSLRCRCENLVDCKPLMKSSPWSAILRPLALSMICAMAVNGFIDLAIDSAADDEAERSDSIDIFAGLKSLRVTKLGKAVLNHMTYTPSVAVEERGVDLFPARRIIAFTGGPNPIESFLAGVADNIGCRRYRLSAEKLIAVTGNEDSLKGAVGTLRNFLADDVAEWEPFFEEVSDRVNCIGNCGVGYIVMRVFRPNPELINLLKTDTRIRGHVVGASHGLLLVERTFCAEFKQILLENGFMI